MATNLPTVLFVEDCDSDFELACLGLEQARVHAHRVSNGRDLKRYLADPQPVDLFILDLSLPDTSGFLIAEQLRNNPPSANKPIVIFSSSTNPRDAEAARKCGADDYHVKPVVPDDFLRVVGQIVSQWLPLDK